MVTTTIPTREYKTLKRKAGLYDSVLRRSARKALEIERYSDARVRELMKADRVSRPVRTRSFLDLKGVIKSSRKPDFKMFRKKFEEAMARKIARV